MQGAFGTIQIQKPADLARMIKTQRQSQGLTQQDVADAVGITRQSLARIERGHGRASFDTVLRIFDRLQIRIEAHQEEKRHVSATTSPPDTEASWEVLSAALQRSRGFDLAPIVAAASATTQNIDTSAMMQNMQSAIKQFAKHLQDSTAKHGSGFSVQRSGFRRRGRPP